MARRTLLLWVLLPALAACATPLDEACVDLAHVAARWLPPIADGSTSPAVLVERFGAPTAEFQDGVLVWVLVLTETTDEPGLDYAGRRAATLGGSGAARTARRARLDRDGRLVTVPASALRDRLLWPTLREAEYHLVVVVADGTVRQHALLRVLQ